MTIETRVTVPSSRKYQRSKRERSPSRYGKRLAARGLSKAPTMPTLATLRHRQGLAAEPRAEVVT